MLCLTLDSSLGGKLVEKDPLRAFLPKSILCLETFQQVHTHDFSYGTELGVAIHVGRLGSCRVEIRVYDYIVQP